jgi:hypothetical protein
MGALMVAALVDIRVTNPTQEKLGVIRFELQVRKPGFIRRWYKAVKNIGFPSTPKLVLPGGDEKHFRVWFDQLERVPILTARTVEAQHSDIAYAFFAMRFDRDMTLPDDALRIRVKAFLGNGDACTATAAIKPRRDSRHLAAFIENGIAVAQVAARRYKVD